MFTSVRIQQ